MIAIIKSCAMWNEHRPNVDGYKALQQLLSKLCDLHRVMQTEKFFFFHDAFRATNAPLLDLPCDARRQVKLLL